MLWDTLRHRKYLKFSDGSGYASCCTFSFKRNNETFKRNVNIDTGQEFIDATLQWADNISRIHMSMKDLSSNRFTQGWQRYWFIPAYKCLLYGFSWKKDPVLRLPAGCCVLTEPLFILTKAWQVYGRIKILTRFLPLLVSKQLNRVHIVQH